MRNEERITHCLEDAWYAASERWRVIVAGLGAAYVRRTISSVNTNRGNTSQGCEQGTFRN